MIKEVSEEKGITATRLSQSIERLQNVERRTQNAEREVAGSIPGTRFKITDNGNASGFANGSTFDAARTTT